MNDCTEALAVAPFSKPRLLRAESFFCFDITSPDLTVIQHRADEYSAM